MRNLLFSLTVLISMTTAAQKQGAFNGKYPVTKTVVQTDDLVLLVDPNWLPTEIGFLQNYIAKILNNKPLYLLLTHSDYDHIIGYQAFKGAKTIASDAFVKNKEKEDEVQVLDIAEIVAKAMG